MKILVFTSLYPNCMMPQHGIFVRERMVNFAHQEGCEIKVVAPVPYFPPVRITHRWIFSQVPLEEFQDGIEVLHPRYFMIPKVGMPLYSRMMYLSVLPALRRLQARFDFDVLDAHYVFPDGAAAVFAGRRLGRPVVVSARGSDINEFKDFRTVRSLLKKTLLASDRIITVSEALKKSVRHLGIPENKITVIPNGVDLTKFHRIPKDEARAALGLPAGPIVLSVGGLSENKGFDLLVRALYCLPADSSSGRPKLVIIGEGYFRPVLERMIRDLRLGSSVTLTGAVRHEQLHLWYSAADVFCLASAREGWPNVILESFACGTPVLATSVGGIPEIIRSGDLGRLVNRNPEDFAAAIAEALKKRWDPESIRAYACSRTWNTVSSSLRSLFEAVSGDHSSISCTT